MQWQCKGIYCWLVPLAVVEVEAASISLSTIRSLSPLSSLLSPLSAAGLGFLSRRPSLGRVSGIRSMHVQQQQYWLLRMQQAYST